MCSEVVDRGVCELLFIGDQLITIKRVQVRPDTAKTEKRGRKVGTRDGLPAMFF